MPPHFRQPLALQGCDKKSLRWPGPFGFGFLSPQPPGIVGIGPIAGKSMFSRANVSWSFLFFGPLSAWTPDRSSALRRGSRAGAHPASAMRDTQARHTVEARNLRSAQRFAIAERCEISAATCRPPPASGQACRGCRPEDRRPRHRRPRAPRSRAAPSSFRSCRSSRRPS